MRRALLALSLAAAVAIVGYSRHLNASTGPIPLNCDRACLEGVMNQYLAAVVKHDPKSLPLSEDVMYTENAQVIKVGDGFWKTAAGIGNYRHYFADPEFGQVAVMGTMLEAGAPLLMSVRLRIELGRITEIEAVFFKPGGEGARARHYYEFQVNALNTQLELFLPSRGSGGYQRFAPFTNFGMESAVRLQGTLNDWRVQHAADARGKSAYAWLIRTTGGTL